ncbi:MAG: MBL fold metallo-hydrolase [Candidatus Thiodiazotropha sp.]|jgi:glyoxylase-like metal-dependent hydrolase (beta-lactamase superfamily II)
MIEYDHQITCIDTQYQRPGLAACYLVRSGDEAAFIDTGTSHSVPHLLSVLETKGIDRSQVRYVIPTHVHLDHAGGVGKLMEACPEASLLIHPYGARHMIDPSKLTAGATAVYGAEAFEALFGTLVPVPETRVIEVPDGMRITLGERELLCLDTPGHARHHICIYDALSGGIFSGDTFGLSYREFDTQQGAYLLPTTTPIQFDPDAWYLTLDRLLELAPERFFLTHYGEVTEVTRLAHLLRSSLHAFVEMARETQAAPGAQRVTALQQRLLGWVQERLKAHGSTLTDEVIANLLAMDLDLDAQGLDVWLSKQEQE